MSPTPTGNSPSPLCLSFEVGGRRVQNPRDVFDGLRFIVRPGSPWCHLPKDFPPWEMVDQQSRRGLAAGGFEAIVHDLRAILRFAAGRDPRADRREPRRPQKVLYRDHSSTRFTQPQHRAYRGASGSGSNWNNTE